MPATMANGYCSKWGGEFARWAVSAAVLAAASASGAELLRLDLDGSPAGRAMGRPMTAELAPEARFLPSVEGQGVAPGGPGPAVIAPLPDQAWRSAGALEFRFMASRRIAPDPTAEEPPTMTLVASPVLHVQLRVRRNLTEMNIAAASEEDSRASRGQLMLSHLKAGRWYHVVFAWDARRGGLEAYLNGQLQQNLRRRDVSGGWRPPASPSGALQLGGLLGEGPAAVRLAVDSVRLHDRFLTAADVAALLQGRSVDPLQGEGRTDYAGSLDLSGHRKRLVWEADFSQPLNYIHEDELFQGDRRVRLPQGKDWVLEGAGRAWTAGGRLHVETTGTEAGGHLVLWNTRVFPANMLVEWEIAPQDPNTGLTILFFAARPKDNPAGSIFDLGLPKRYGLFSNYHSGALNSYHISYWAPPRRTANLRKNHGFYLASCGIDRIAGRGPAPQPARLLKLGGHIELETCGRRSLVYDDDGRTYGPVWGDGYIGLRQMGHSRHVSYASFRVWELK